MIAMTYNALSDVEQSLSFLSTAPRQKGIKTRLVIKSSVLVPYLGIDGMGYGFDVTLLASYMDPMANRGWTDRSLRVAGEMESRRQN
jgi:hypothetical protein